MSTSPISPNNYDATHTPLSDNALDTIAIKLDRLTKETKIFEQDLLAYKTACLPKRIISALRISPEEQALRDLLKAARNSFVNGLGATPDSKKRSQED